MKLSGISDGHVGEQDAEIRLIDAELRLNRLGRQANLATGDAATRCNPMIRVERLNRVGAVDIGRLQTIAQRCDGPRAVGLPQTQRQCRMIGCHDRPPSCLERQRARWAACRMGAEFGQIASARFFP